MLTLVSPARPLRAERGSGELPIVELFCTAPKTGWSRNAITRCGFHNNVVLRNTHGIQWNPSNPDTTGAMLLVLIIEVSSFEGLHI